MEGTVKELSRYRYEKSRGCLEMAKDLFEEEKYSFAQNRAYYAVFYAIRAVNALDQYDSSKHSGVIAHFNQSHVKTGEFDPSVSVIIRKASRLRERSDYEDFYEPEKDETEQIILEVREFLASVRAYLTIRKVFI